MRFSRSGRERKPRYENDMAYGDEIRGIVQRRGIPWLVHFTPIANIPSILRNGLMSREEILHRKIDAVGTDPWRLDGDQAAVSLSISHINAAMLAAKRREFRHVDWAVVYVEPRVLWTHRCRFCPRNAAHRDVTRMAHRLFGAWAFEAMFEDADPLGRFNGPSYRLHADIPMYWPTQRDAEVQVRGRIAPELIMAVQVENHRFVEPIGQLLNSINADGGDRNVGVCSIL
jgi:hypothetical protein